MSVWVLTDNLSVTEKVSKLMN